MFTEPDPSTANQDEEFLEECFAMYKHLGMKPEKLNRQGATRLRKVAQEGAMHWIVTHRSLAIRQCVLAGFPSNAYNRLQRQEAGESKGSCNQLQRECQKSTALQSGARRGAAERIVNTRRR